MCKHVFLFYYGETFKRLKYLQKHLIEVGISMPIHGNTNRIPKHALNSDEKATVGSFIINFAAAHGIPDPGRNLRTGKRKLIVLLPAILNYMSVYRIYQQSTGGNCVSYKTFIRIWHEVAPHICFIKPRSDLCMKCENFKKALNRITSDLTQERDNEKIKLHQQAIEHLERAKKERNYYSSSTRRKFI